MRSRTCLSLALGAVLFATSAHAARFTKLPDLGPNYHSISASGSYVYADSFVAPQGTNVPVSLGTWLQLYGGTSQSVRFEIWGDSGGPDHTSVLATTGSVTPGAFGGALSFFSYPVASYPATTTPVALVPGTRYWFVITVVGETVSNGQFQVGGHTQNSVYHDNGVFDASNESSGATFNYVNHTPEMAFQVGLSDVLLLDIPTCFSESHYPAAFTLLEEPSYVVDNVTDFYDLLTDGIPWRVVLIDDYATELSTATQSALATYVAGGGHVGIDYWGWLYDPSFAATFDASYVSYFSTPLQIFPWVPDHPLWTAPNALPNSLQWTDDPCTTGTVDGATFNPTSYGRVIAYFGAVYAAPTASPAYSSGPDFVDPTTDDAAIIVGNGGRTVLFGGMLANYNGVPIGLPVAGSTPAPKIIDQSYGERMAANIADYLLHVIFVDGFESGGDGAWSDSSSVATLPQPAAEGKN